MLDFLKLARDRHLPYILSGHHHCHEGWAQVHCLCTGCRHGWHLGWNLEKGFFHCWRCGPINKVQYLSAALRLPPGDVLGLLRQYETNRTPPRRTPVARPPSVPLPQGTGPLGRAHRLYLEGRGFDPDRLVEEWGLLATGQTADAWRWRVIIPITHEGELAAYQGRAIGPDVQPRYHTTDATACTVPPTELIYGLDRVPGDHVVIVEGVTGVWRLGPGAVATLGIDWKREQANRLRTFPTRYILFDPEPLARRKAISLARHLSQFGGHTEVLDDLPTDSGALPWSKVKRLREIYLYGAIS